MALERLRSRGAVVGAVAVVLVAGVSVASLVVAEGRLEQFHHDADTAAPSTPTVVESPPSTTAPPAPPAPPAPATAPPVVAGPPAGFATELFALMNADRASRGLTALTWDNRLAGTAQHASDAMADAGLVAPQDLGAILALGYARGAENVLTGPYSVTATSAQYGWMGSNPHRAVILGADFSNVGIGATSSADGRIWIAVDFGG
jgi:uncharacterized protein YkwD